MGCSADATTAIRAFVSRAAKGSPVGDDDDIFGTGIVNSLFAMELVLFVERTFGIAIETEDLDIENFRSVNRVSRLVARKLGAGTSEPVATRE